MNNFANNLLIIIEENHPHFAAISTHYETKSIDEALASFESYDLIIDLSVLRTKKKALLLKELAKTTKSEIISDLSLCWGDYIFRTCPHVIGALSMLFFSPTNSVEFAINPHVKAEADEITKHIKDFLSKLNIESIAHQNLKLGFHYPRTISMIINEAFFALEENLATPEAIDLAMKNGVNYPLGPIEWGKKIGLNHVVDLLNELYEVTEDSRYRVSKELKLISQLTGQS